MVMVARRLGGKLRLERKIERVQLLVCEGTVRLRGYIGEEELGEAGRRSKSVSYSMCRCPLECTTKCNRDCSHVYNEYEINSGFSPLNCTGALTGFW